MRKKALLAIALASGAVNPQLPVSAKEAIESQPVQVIDCIKGTYVSPETRAYFLLSIANQCLGGAKKANVEKQFGAVDKTIAYDPLKFRRWNYMLQALMQQVSQKAYEEVLSGARGQALPLEKIGKDERDLANKATKEAYQLLKQSPSDENRLELLFMASCMQQRLGNMKEAEIYTQTIDQELRSYEEGKSVRIARAEAAVTVLNAKSYGIIPMQILDFKSTTTPNIKAFSAEEFKASEALRLRALAIADKTPSTEHVRRKAHRDMVLWYQTLGKAKLAEEEKHVLFQLVGFQNENALYPNNKGCGYLEWWQAERIPCTRLCGMG